MTAQIRDLEAAIRLLRLALPLADVSASHHCAARIQDAIEIAETHLRRLHSTPR